LDLSQCQQLISELEARILSRWYVTLENDYLVMTYLGLLQRLYPEGDLHPLLAFKSRATEQVYALSELSRMMKRNPGLWDAVSRGDADQFIRRLQDHPDVKGEYQRYLEVFGGRFANELKLETVGIDEDTGKFLNVVRNYASFTASNASRLQYTMPALPLLKRLAFRHFLGRFRKQASEREICRLLRSNMFSIARKLFRRMGAILVEAGALGTIEDVFYLEVEELLALPEDLGGHSVLRQRVANRNREYEQFREEEPPIHFVARLGAAEPSKAAAGAGLTARGVSPGVVAGKVKVMREFAMPEQIDFDIIVARNMDPGWTALVALSKGLVIEHGGALSHAAIVARELGIPAVIGLQDATTRFKNGQRVELDGSTGSVRAL
jgi:pyruvate,water dikinase